MCKTVQTVSELKTEYNSNSEDSFLLTSENASSTCSDTRTVSLIVNDVLIKF